MTFTYDILATDVIIINRGDCCGKFSIGMTKAMNPYWAEGVFYRLHCHMLDLVAIINYVNATDMIHIRRGVYGSSST